MDLEYEDEYAEEVDEGEEDNPPQPSQEEIEYLQLRKRLKERIRSQMKKDGGSAAYNELPDKKRNLPYDNYGSFFGPSQPIISKRVIEESKSLLETRHFNSKSQYSDISHDSPFLKKDSSLIANGANGKPTSMMSEVKMKVQKIKDSRDYSFLLSDDAEMPQAQSPVNLKLDMLKSRQESKGKHAPPGNMRQFQGRFEERGAVSVNNAKKQNSGSFGPTLNKSQFKPAAPSSFSKQPINNRNSNGIGRAVEIKGNSRIPPAPAQRQAPSSSKSSLTKNMKNPSSNLTASLPKRPFSHPSKPNNVPNQRVKAKETIIPSKNTVNRSSKIASNARTHEYHNNKKPSNRFSDEDGGDEDDQAINMIRKMFGYNPNKFCSGDDDDDSDMEANFTDIQEEERRSSRIARREDEEELRKMEEEEEMLRLRKIERKRKLNQR